MVLHVLAEERSIGEAQAVANLLDAEVGMAEIVSDVFQYMFRHPLAGRLARVFLANGSKVFRRDEEVVGIVFHGAMLHLNGMQEVQESLKMHIRCSDVVIDDG